MAYDVSQLDEVTLEEAIAEVGLTGDAYTHNADAKFFYKVAASMTYITESSESDVPAENGRFERTDRYTYILELDEDRRIIGGEWTGSSRSKQPDVLWNPRRAYRSSVQHLDLEQVRMLICKSREPVEPEPAPVVPAEPVSFSVNPGTEIPDNDIAGVGIELTVGSGLSGAVEVTVDIAHPSAVDVMVGLISPSGEKWTIVAQGSSRGRNINKTIALDPAPVGDLGGTWRLNVSDRLSADVGTVEGFAIKVTPAE